jgi:regulator of protease activity HflC (stomatin/prohibitin superfamily)
MGIAIILGIVFSMITVICIAIAFYIFRKEYILRYYKSADILYAKIIKWKFVIGLLVILMSIGSLISFIFIPFGYYQVDAGEIAVLRRKGKIIGIQNAGLYIRNILTQKVSKYDIKTQQLDITTEVYTRDAQPMTAQLTLQFSIEINKVKEIAIKFGTLKTLKIRIESIAIEKAKSVLACNTAMELIENRSLLSSLILSEIKTLETQYFLTFENVVLTDMAFSDAFEQAVEQKMVEQQKVEQARAAAERQKIEAEAKLAVAQIEASIKVALANADADALQVMVQAWDGLSTEVRELMLQQLAIEKWDGKMPETVVGNDFFTMLFGALGGK